MHVSYQLNSDELNENFLQAIRRQFNNQAIEIEISDIPAKVTTSLTQGGIEPRKAGALKGRIKMGTDFNAPLADFAEYQP